MTDPTFASMARRTRPPRLILALLAPAIVALAWSASARAGTFTVSGCPGGSGWSQVPATTNYVTYTQPCAGGSTAGPSIQLGPDQNPPEGFAPNVNSGMVFQVPAGMTVSSYTLDLSAYGGPCSIASNQCATGEGYVWVTHSGQNGTINDFNDLGQGPESAVISPSGLSGVTSVMIGVNCDPGPGGYSCPGSNGGPSGAEAAAQVSFASFQVTSSATPTGSGFGGTLLDPSSHGSATLLFTAGDAGGPGVYNVTVQIDGTAVYSGTPNTNAGACTSSGTDAASGTRIFSSLQPCPLTESLDIPIDTTNFRDGQHQLQVQVTDAAQNTSTVLDEAITTDNLTTVSGLLPTPSNTKPTPTPAPAPTPTPAPSAAPTAPSYAAALDAPTVKLAHGITRAYGRSALTLAGTLHNSSGTAAPGVTIVLTALPAGSSAPAATLAQTTTNASGQWTLRAPPGLSRTLRVVYGNPAQATPASTLVSVHEAMAPTLTLHITSRDGVLHFSGRILPADMKPAPALEVEVKGPGTIQTVGLPTYPAADGTYDSIFAIRHADIGHTFTFRAIILSRSYQYTPTKSPWQKAVVH